MTAIRPNLPKLLVPLAAFASALILLVALRGPGEIEPPARAGSVDIDIPPTASTDKRLRIIQRRVRDGIGGAEGYATLGDAYLQKARETGDSAYYSRAERSFSVALRRDARNLTAVLGAATLAGSRHDFREQLRLGLEARRLVPGLVGSYAVIADAQIELGRYRGAERTIQRLLDRKPNLASYARASYYRELNGDLEGAAQAMRLAVSAGAGAAENVAYVQALLGDLELARGRVGPAQQAYRTALERVDSYAPALAGLARVDIAFGRLAPAARRLQAAGERLPLTTLFTLLAEVELAAGRRDAAERALAVVRAQRRLLRSAGAVADADLVVFDATHGDPAAAVRLGRRVWRAAPSVRSADALGWALTRSGRPADGLRWARRALRLGSRDPQFRFHAGIAALGAGRKALARRELRLALTLNPGFSPWLARQARSALKEAR
jgi:tetratricopeptide (TPR) repeat protein